MSLNVPFAWQALEAGNQRDEEKKQGYEEPHTPENDRLVSRFSLMLGCQARGMVNLVAIVTVVAGHYASLAIGH